MESQWSEKEKQALKQKLRMMREEKGRTLKGMIQLSQGGCWKGSDAPPREERGKEWTVVRIIPELGRSEASGGTSQQLSLGRQPFLFNSKLFAGDMVDMQGSVWALLAAFCLCRCKSRETDLRSLSSVLFLSHNESSAEFYWYLM